MATAKEILEQYHTALGKKDYATARRFLQDNLSFRGPLETLHKADDYLEAIKKLGSIVERTDVKKMFVDGNDICVLYDLVTKTPAGTAFVAEWFQIKEGKIASIQVVFDARPFAAMFAK